MMMSVKVSHVLWECPAYSSNFLVALKGKLGDDGFKHFQSVSGKHPLF